MYVLGMYVLVGMYVCTYVCAMVPNQAVPRGLLHSVRQASRPVSQSDEQSTDNRKVTKQKQTGTDR